MCKMSDVEFEQLSVFSNAVWPWLYLDRVLRIAILCYSSLMIALHSWLPRHTHSIPFQATRNIISRDFERCYPLEHLPNG